MSSQMSSSNILRENMSFLRSCLRWFQKIFVHWLTGKSELERLCDGTLNIQTVNKVRKSILLSKQLKETRNILCSCEIFDIDALLSTILRKKKIPSNTKCSDNLRMCFLQFYRINSVYQIIFKYKDTPYDSDNPDHEEMLETLWEGLKPGIRRKGGRYTEEWSEIGFQGVDPKTDFRSMGIFSLQQLVYFSQKHPKESKRALHDSNHPTKWYPLAATGINITSFTIDCLKEHLLDYRILDRLTTYPDNTTSRIVMDVAREIVDEFYSEVFVELNDAWTSSSAVNLMEFPRIQKSVTQSIRNRLIHENFE